uniref:Uncharacterized protein n=1 Tax=Knipowitschia caucasica TaxID=637954 RepID=A0AAV2M3E6_KNICA
MDTAAVVTVLVLTVAGLSHTLHIVPSASQETSNRLLDSSLDSEELTLALKTLLFGSERETRNSVLHQPQRFGRNSRGPLVSEGPMVPQEVAPGQVWSLAVPQRFGKK